MNTFQKLSLVFAGFMLAREFSKTKPVATTVLPEAPKPNNTITMPQQPTTVATPPITGGTIVFTPNTPAAAFNNTTPAPATTTIPNIPTNLNPYSGQNNNATPPTTTTPNVVSSSQNMQFNNLNQQAPNVSVTNAIGKLIFTNKSFVIVFDKSANDNVLRITSINSYLGVVTGIFQKNGKTYYRFTSNSLENKSFANKLQPGFNKNFPTNISKRDYAVEAMDVKLAST